VPAPNHVSASGRGTDLEFEFLPEKCMKEHEKGNEGRQKRLKDLKALVRSRLAEKKRNSTLVPPDPPPRYDEMFFEGTAWLDNQAGDPLEEVE
jgi:hypothetical protein